MLLKSELYAEIGVLINFQGFVSKITNRSSVFKVNFAPLKTDYTETIC